MGALETSAMSEFPELTWPQHGFLFLKLLLNPAKWQVQPPVPSRAPQAKPGVAATPALRMLPVPGRLPLGVLLKHMSGAPPVCRARLSLGSRDAGVRCPERTKRGFPWIPRAQGVLLPGSLGPAPNPHLQELSQGQGTWTPGRAWVVSFPGLPSDRASPEQPMRSSAISG